MALQHESLPVRVPPEDSLNSRDGPHSANLDARVLMRRSVPLQMAAVQFHPESIMTSYDSAVLMMNNVMTKLVSTPWPAAA